jgi:hypothetical protein
MDALDYWRLCDDLSVVQTALLILGVEFPGLVESRGHHDRFLFPGT